MSRYLTIVLVMIISRVAMGETVTIESTGHYVPLNDPDMIELEKKYEAYHGYERHITAIGKDGKTESHWCIGTNLMNDDELAFGAGYCTILDEDGDAYWTWFQVRKRGGFDWQVKGGTGKYEGSTGSGFSKAVSSLPDGTTTLEINGTIELPD
jgi:hypothetical protein